MKRILLVLLCLTAINMEEVNAQNSDEGTVFYGLGGHLDYAGDYESRVYSDIYKFCGDYEDYEDEIDEWGILIRDYVDDNYPPERERFNIIVGDIQWGPDKKYKTYEEAYSAAQSRRDNYINSSEYRYAKETIHITRSDLNLDVNPSECGFESPGGDESSAGNKDGAWGWGRGNHLAVYLYESDGGIGINEVDNLIGYDTDNTWSEWSKEWKPLYTCYQGIDFKVRRSQKKDVIRELRDFASRNLDDKKYYIWQIALRNRYNKDAYFEFGTTGVRPTTPAVGKRYQEETLDAGYDDLSYNPYSIPKSVERYAYTEKGDYVYLIIKNFRLGDDDEVGYGAEYGGIGAKTKKYDKNEFEPCDR